MNILYIAYSCSPYNGSEDKIGWNVPWENSKSNRVFVLTKEDHRDNVEQYLSQNPNDNISFYFVDVPQVYKKVYKGPIYSGLLNVWHRCVLPVAREICQKESIQIIHQITPIEFRSIGNYTRIPNIKFVVGPLGGGEYIPAGLKSYAQGHLFIENIRKILNYMCRIRLKVTRKLEKCDFVMYANEETYAYLNGGTILTEIAEENTVRCREIRNSDRCIFLVAGRLIYRKGLNFLFDVLERLPDDLDYQCRIVGSGTEYDTLKRRCSSSTKLEQHVVFIKKIPFNEMGKEYNNASVLIMPSIRETTGSVLLEAMAYGVPVITINAFGGKVIIDEETGWLYSGTSKEDYLNSLGSVITDCVVNPNEVLRKAINAQWESRKFTWAEKVRKYNEIYSNLLEEVDSPS